MINLSKTHARRAHDTDITHVRVEHSTCPDMYARKEILKKCKLLQVFLFQSNGNMVNLDREGAGSILIAQEFSSPKFFHPGPASGSTSSFAGTIT
jgi:hypothetical protein